MFSTHGPQPYALAVLGKFDGVLASAGNPASREGSPAQASTCRIVVTTITDGPSGLTNKTYALPASSQASTELAAALRVRLLMGKMEACMACQDEIYARSMASVGIKALMTIAGSSFIQIYTNCNNF